MTHLRIQRGVGELRAGASRSFGTLHARGGGEETYATILACPSFADPLSETISVPVMVAKGAHAGPVVGITSAIHGNELNGIPIIHRLFRWVTSNAGIRFNLYRECRAKNLGCVCSELDCSTLCGIVVAVPVVNVHGYTRFQRGFSDGVDLNRIMPGKKAGTA